MTNRCFPSGDHGTCKNVCDGNRDTCCHASDGGLAVGYLFVVVYLFVGIAIVCDEWFVPSLEEISSTLRLSEDVAGATFMAAGSSAPELFTSMADAFGDQSSMGVGTIVGSAMFNILIIVALSAAVVPGSVLIDWRPVVRDSVSYTHLPLPTNREV